MPDVGILLQSNDVVRRGKHQSTIVKCFQSNRQDIGMLQAFRLKNFRSFASPQILNLAASSDRTHEKTHCVASDKHASQRFLRAAAIFGPNASGKSNFVAAIQCFRDLTLKSYSGPRDQLIPLYTPFKFGSCGDAPTAMGIDVLLSGIRYSYDLAYDARQIRWERLLVYTTSKAQRWFERRATVTGISEWAPFSSHLRGPREMWRRATAPTSLFLSTAHQLKCVRLNPFVEWLANGLSLYNHPSHGDLSQWPATLAKPQQKAMMITFLKGLDVQISDIRLAEKDFATAHPAERSRMYQRNSDETLDVEVQHAAKGGSAGWIPSDREGAGVRELLVFLPKLCATARAGGQLVVDDFGKHLHPTVASSLLTTALKSSAPSFQFIATTHETTLMDMDLLRRDQMWLVEPGVENSSQLIALIRRHTQRSVALSRYYLSGRFGAVPRFRTAGS